MGNLELLIKVLAQSLPAIYVGLGRRRGLQGNALARRIVHSPLSLPEQNF
ncbi:hypothetical protein TIFTF001_023752 [Ficus carica]|uniref:Uncharacterized protein n=1 Tax=Ficus carica TaxID=3494 RepID=A0AA88AP06_FICCA|nr:hypothetical protein TIFTF001_023752 [Ficus carica]